TRKQPLKTTPLQRYYEGEHLPGNKQWKWVKPGGSQVKYLNATERARLALTVKDGKFYNADGNLFDTSVGGTEWSGEGRAIYVMDEQGNIFASTKHQLGAFHHSSFLGGKQVAAAGELEVRDGLLVGLSDRSGHYAPAREFT